MANRYSQIFSLSDIFNNKNLRDKLPFIDYREKELENGKTSYRTNLKTINRQVFDTATSAARPYYKPIRTIRYQDIMVITGNLVGDHNSAVDAVYNSLLAKKQLLGLTVNNAYVIRSALKETEKNKRKYGINSKLYLKLQSIQQINGMNEKQVQSLVNEVMENIFYGDDYPETQKKFNIENLNVGSRQSYEQRKLKWKNKVGDL